MPTHTLHDGSGLDVWYWTVMSSRSGDVVWRRWVGTGSQFDGCWPLRIIAHNGTLFMSADEGVLATGTVAGHTGSGEVPPMPAVDALRH